MNSESDTLMRVISLFLLAMNRHYGRFSGLVLVQISRKITINLVKSSEKGEAIVLSHSTDGIYAYLTILRVRAGRCYQYSSAGERQL